MENRWLRNVVSGDTQQVSAFSVQISLLSAQQEYKRSKIAV